MARALITDNHEAVPVGQRVFCSCLVGWTNARRRSDKITIVGGVDTTVSLFVFIVGACVGSFLNVLIYRIPAGMSLVLPPSHCTHCGSRLHPRDLIPIVSFILLRGRCRYCQAGIPWHYPLVEAATGILFTLVWLNYGYSWATPAGWVFTAVLVGATATDIMNMIIPDEILAAGIVAGVPFLLLDSFQGTLWGLLAGLAAGGFMLAIAVLSRGGMGGGDIKLAAFMGLFLGPKMVGLALFLAFLLGGAVSIALIVSGKKGRKELIPFGPYLALGGILALLRGEHIITWYLGLWGW